LQGLLRDCSGEVKGDAGGAGGECPV